MCTSLLLALLQAGPVRTAPDDLVMPPPPLVRGELAERIHAYLRGAETFGFDGVVLVEVGGELVLHQAYGLADRASGTSTTTDTLYALASLSKSYTAALVLDLVERGELALEATLGELVPEVPEDKAAITVEQLLAHTSGLGYHPSPPAQRAGREPDVLLAALLTEPAGVPGTFAYSNVGYTVLALLCERATGESFEDLVRERVFGPRGLRHTSFNSEAHALDLPYARSWMDGSDQGTPREWPGETAFLGAGGVVATGGDVLAWLRSLTSEQTRARSAGRGSLEYAAGWFRATTPRDTAVVFHAGDYLSFNVEARVYLDEDRRLVLLSNARQSGTGLREPVLHRVALLAAGESVPTPPVAVQPDAEASAALAGDYADEDGRTLTLAPTERGLDASSESPELLSLLSSGPASPALADNERRLLDAARERDFALADELQHRAVLRQGSRTALELALDRIASRIGDIRSLELVGRIERGGNGSARSWWRAVGDDDACLVRLTWMDDLMVGMRVDVGTPSLELVSTAAGTYTSFDLFRDARVDVQVDEGSVAGVQLIGPNGAARLERQ